jgi:hypothetical protein
MSALVVTTPEELAAIVRKAVVEALASTKPADSEPLFARVAAYATRCGLSERYIWSLVAKGLPTVDEGRGRRVDVVVFQNVTRPLYAAFRS